MAEAIFYENIFSFNLFNSLNKTVNRIHTHHSAMMYLTIQMKWFQHYFACLIIIFNRYFSFFSRVRVSAINLLHCFCFRFESSSFIVYVLNSTIRRSADRSVFFVVVVVPCVRLTVNRASHIHKPNCLFWIVKIRYESLFINFKNQNHLIIAIVMAVLLCYCACIRIFVHMFGGWFLWDRYFRKVFGSRAFCEEGGGRVLGINAVTSK